MNPFAVPFFTPCQSISPDGVCTPARVDTEPPCIPPTVEIHGRCLLPAPPNPQHLNCKAVHVEIEPACLQAQGCTPEPGVAIALLFTLLVQCL